MSHCIVFSGEKISPLEIDDVLLSHPAVSEAVAFAAPDEKFGEEVFILNIFEAVNEISLENCLVLEIFR